MKRLIALFIVGGMVASGCGPATTSSKKTDPAAGTTVTSSEIKKTDMPTKPDTPAPKEEKKPEEKKPEEKKPEDKKDDKKEDKKN